MSTLNEWGLKVLRQVRLDVAPSAIGWNPDDNDIKALVERALVTVGHPNPNGRSGRDVRDTVIHRVISGVAPGYWSRSRVEEDMWPRQMDEALALAGSYFVEAVAAEDPTTETEMTNVAERRRSRNR